MNTTTWQTTFFTRLVLTDATTNRSDDIAIESRARFEDGKCLCVMTLITVMNANRPTSLSVTLYPFELEFLSSIVKDYSRGNARSQRFRTRNCDDRMISLEEQIDRTGNKTLLIRQMTDMSRDRLHEASYGVYLRCSDRDNVRKFNRALCSALDDMAKYGVLEPVPRIPLEDAGMDHVSAMLLQAEF